MVSLGEELKREREFRDISLRDISDATKINMRMLEAIEKNDFTVLPGGIFARNFIRAYAEFIGLDPEVAVRKFQQQAAVTIEPKVPPFVVSLARTDVPGKTISVKMILIILAILILAAAGGLWAYKTKFSSRVERDHGGLLHPVKNSLLVLS